MAIMEYRTSWWLTVVRILYFAPFYAMGIFYKKILEKYVDRIPSVVYFAITESTKQKYFSERNWRATNGRNHKQRRDPEH